MAEFFFSFFSLCPPYLDVALYNSVYLENRHQRPQQAVKIGSIAYASEGRVRLILTCAGNSLVTPTKFATKHIHAQYTACTKHKKP